MNEPGGAVQNRGAKIRFIDLLHNPDIRLSVAPNGSLILRRRIQVEAVQFPEQFTLILAVLTETRSSRDDNNMPILRSLPDDGLFRKRGFPFRSTVTAEFRAFPNHLPAK